MLNPFPTMWLSLLAFFILRVTVGFVLIHLGSRHLRERGQLLADLRARYRTLPPIVIPVLALAELTIGGLLLIGYHTQYAALAGVVLALTFLVFRGATESELVPPRLFFVLLLGAFLSLFITGAGIFAFDLPL